MTEAFDLNLEGIGPVFFERSPRSKHINISVRPLKGVRVAMPRGVSLEEAKRAAYSNLGWIKKKLKRMEKWTQKELSVPDIPFDVDPEAIKGWLRAKTKDLAQRYGFKYNSVTIRKQRTRWGSCSGKNNISLNAKLAWLPEELVNYVIVHELMHTRIKSHGPVFWKAMDEILGSAKTVDARLRDYHLEVL